MVGGIAPSHLAGNCGGARVGTGIAMVVGSSSSYCCSRCPPLSLPVAASLPHVQLKGPSPPLEPLLEHLPLRHVPSTGSPVEHLQYLLGLVLQPPPLVLDVGSSFQPLGHQRIGGGIVRGNGRGVVGQHGPYPGRVEVDVGVGGLQELGEGGRRGVEVAEVFQYGFGREGIGQVGFGDARAGGGDDRTALGGGGEGTASAAAGSMAIGRGGTGATAVREGLKVLHDLI